MYFFVFSSQAYMDNEYENIKLPGFDEYTSEQLFYLNFAQVSIMVLEYCI